MMKFNPRPKTVFMLLVTVVSVLVVTSVFTPMAITVIDSRTRVKYGSRSENPFFQPECIDCIQVNTSITINGFGSFKFPEPNCHGKLLVYECLSGDVCGGLADRQKGIMSSFLLALLTNRTFVLNHRKSCDMKKVMPPRVYNWYKCIPQLFQYSYKSQYTLNYIDAKGDLPSNFSVLPPGDIWEEHIVKLHVNTRLNMAVKEHPDAKWTIPWLFSASDRAVVCGLMKVLFKPEEHIEEHINSFIEEHTSGGRKKLVAVHIRTTFLVKERDLPVYFRALYRYNDTNKYVIYFATDDEDVRKMAERTFSNFVSLNTNIVHIDTVNSACDGMYTAVFEQQILARADILYLSHSGFSRLAACIRDRSENLYSFFYGTDAVEAHFKQVQLEDIVDMYPTS